MMNKEQTVINRTMRRIQRIVSMILIPAFLLSNSVFAEVLIERASVATAVPYYISALLDEHKDDLKDLARGVTPVMDRNFVDRKEDFEKAWDLMCAERLALKIVSKIKQDEDRGSMADAERWLIRQIEDRADEYGMSAERKAFLVEAITREFRGEGADEDVIDAKEIFETRQVEDGGQASKGIEHSADASHQALGISRQEADDREQKTEDRGRDYRESPTGGKSRQTPVASFQEKQKINRERRTTHESEASASANRRRDGERSLPGGDAQRDGRKPYTVNRTPEARHSPSEDSDDPAAEEPDEEMGDFLDSLEVPLPQDQDFPIRILSSSFIKECELIREFGLKEETGAYIALYRYNGEPIGDLKTGGEFILKASIRPMAGMNALIGPTAGFHSKIGPSENVPDLYGVIDFGIEGRTVSGHKLYETAILKEFVEGPSLREYVMAMKTERSDSATEQQFLDLVTSVLRDYRDTYRINGWMNGDLDSRDIVVARARSGSGSRNVFIDNGTATEYGSDDPAAIARKRVVKALYCSFKRFMRLSEREPAEWCLPRDDGYSLTIALLDCLGLIADTPVDFQESGQHYIDVVESRVLSDIHSPQLIDRLKSVAAMREHVFTRIVRAHENNGRLEELAHVLNHYRKRFEDEDVFNALLRDVERIARGEPSLGPDRGLEGFGGAIERKSPSADISSEFIVHSSQITDSKEQELEDDQADDRTPKTEHREPKEPRRSSPSGDDKTEGPEREDSIDAIRDADTLSNYVDGLIADINDTQKDAQISFSDILASPEGYNESFFEPLYEILFRKLSRDFSGSEEFVEYCGRAIGQKGADILRVEMNGENLPLIGRIGGIRRNNNTKKASIELYGFLFFLLAREPKKYLARVYDEFMKTRPAEDIALGRRGISYHDRGDSVVHFYTKGVIFEGIVKPVYKKSLMPIYEHEKTVLEDRTGSDSAKKIGRALQYWQTQGYMPGNERLLERVKNFWKSTTVVELDMRTPLLFSDPDHNVVRSFHAGRTRRVLFFSKAYLDSLSIDSEADMKELAFWLSFGQRFIDMKDEMEAKGFDSRQIEQARSALSLLYFEDVFIKCQEDASLIDPLYIKDRCRRYMRQDTFIKYTTLLRETIEKEKEADALLRQADKTKAQEHYALAWFLYGKLLYKYDGMGLHSEAEKAYQNMTSATRECQLHNWGLLPYRVYMFDTFTALRFGKWPEFVEGLETFLTGKGYKRRMWREEANLLRNCLCGHEGIYRDFREVIERVIHSQMDAADTEVLSEITPHAERAFDLLKRFYEDGGPERCLEIDTLPTLPEGNNTEPKPDGSSDKKRRSPSGEEDSRQSTVRSPKIEKQDPRESPTGGDDRSGFIVHSSKLPTEKQDLRDSPTGGKSRQTPVASFQKKQKINREQRTTNESEAKRSLPGGDAQRDDRTPERRSPSADRHDSADAVEAASAAPDYREWLDRKVPSEWRDRLTPKQREFLTVYYQTDKVLETKKMSLFTKALLSLGVAGALGFPVFVVPSASSALTVAGLIFFMFVFIPTHEAGHYLAARAVNRASLRKTGRPVFSSIRYAWEGTFPQVRIEFADEFRQPKGFIDVIEWGPTVSLITSAAAFAITGLSIFFGWDIVSYFSSPTAYLTFAMFLFESFWRFGYSNDGSLSARTNKISRAFKKAKRSYSFLGEDPIHWGIEAEDFLIDAGDGIYWAVPEESWNETDLLADRVRVRARESLLRNRDVLFGMGQRRPDGAAIPDEPPENVSHIPFLSDTVRMDSIRYPMPFELSGELVKPDQGDREGKSSFIVRSVFNPSGRRYALYKVTDFPKELLHRSKGPEPSAGESARRSPSGEEISPESGARSREKKEDGYRANDEILDTRYKIQNPRTSPSAAIPPDADPAFFESSSPPYWMMGNDLIAKETKRLAAKLLDQASAERAGRPWSYEEIQKLLQTHPEITTKLQFEKAEYYHIPEIAAYANLALDEESRAFYDEAERIFKKIVHARSEEEILSLARHLKEINPRIAVVILKWLASTTEMHGSKYAAEERAARRFLRRFVNLFFGELGGREAINDYLVMAANMVQKARRERDLMPDEVAVVPVLTGGGTLRDFANTRLFFSVHRVRPLLFTRVMAQAYGVEEVDGRRRFTREGAEAVCEYLKLQEIIDDRIRHIVFLDVGQRGTIRELLTPILDKLSITSDLPVLYHGKYAEADRHLAHGLNDEPAWRPRDEELLWMAYILDDGFEKSIDVSNFVLEEKPRGRLPFFKLTNSLWFYRLVQERTQIAASGLPVYSRNLYDTWDYYRDEDENDPAFRHSPSGDDDAERKAQSLRPLRALGPEGAEQNLEARESAVSPSAAPDMEKINKAVKFAIDILKRDEEKRALRNTCKQHAPLLCYLLNRMGIDAEVSLVYYDNFMLREVHYCVKIPGQTPIYVDSLPEAHTHRISRDPGVGVILKPGDPDYELYVDGEKLAGQYSGGLANLTPGARMLFGVKEAEKEIDAFIARLTGRSSGSAAGEDEQPADDRTPETIHRKPEEPRRSSSGSDAARPDRDKALPDVPDDLLDRLPEREALIQIIRMVLDGRARGPRKLYGDQDRRFNVLRLWTLEGAAYQDIIGQVDFTYAAAREHKRRAIISLADWLAPYGVTRQEIKEVLKSIQKPQFLTMKLGDYRAWHVHYSNWVVGEAEAPDQIQFNKNDKEAWGQILALLRELHIVEPTFDEGTIIPRKDEHGYIIEIRDRNGEARHQYLTCFITGKMLNPVSSFGIVMRGSRQSELRLLLAGYGPADLLPALGDVKKSVLHLKGGDYQRVRLLKTPQGRSIYVTLSKRYTSDHIKPEISGESLADSAKTRITLYDPDTNEPVSDVIVWTDRKNWEWEDQRSDKYIDPSENGYIQWSAGQWRRYLAGSRRTPPRQDKIDTYPTPIQRSHRATSRVVRMLENEIDLGYEDECPYEQVKRCALKIPGDDRRFMGLWAPEVDPATTPPLVVLRLTGKTLINTLTIPAEYEIVTHETPVETAEKEPAQETVLEGPGKEVPPPVGRILKEEAPEEAAGEEKSAQEADAEAPGTAGDDLIHVSIGNAIRFDEDEIEQARNLTRRVSSKKRLAARSLSAQEQDIVDMVLQGASASGLTDLYLAAWSDLLKSAMIKLVTTDLRELPQAYAKYRKLFSGSAGAVGKKKPKKKTGRKKRHSPSGEEDSSEFGVGSSETKVRLSPEHQSASNQKASRESPSGKNSSRFKVQGSESAESIEEKTGEPVIRRLHRASDHSLIRRLQHVSNHPRTFRGGIFRGANRRTGELANRKAGQPKRRSPSGERLIIPDEYRSVGSEKFREIFGKEFGGLAPDAEQLASLLDRLNPAVFDIHRSVCDNNGREIYPYWCHPMSRVVAQVLKDRGFDVASGSSIVDAQEFGFNVVVVHHIIILQLSQGNVLLDYTADQYYKDADGNWLHIEPVIMPCAEAERGAFYGSVEKGAAMRLDERDRKLYEAINDALSGSEDRARGETPRESPSGEKSGSGFNVQSSKLPTAGHKPLTEYRKPVRESPSGEENRLSSRRKGTRKEELAQRRVKPLSDVVISNIDKGPVVAESELRELVESTEKFGGDWRNRIVTAMADPESVTLLARRHGRIVGFITGVEPDESDRELIGKRNAHYLLGIGVRPEEQDQRIATALFARYTKTLKRLGKYDSVALHTRDDRIFRIIARYQDRVIRTRRKHTDRGMQIVLSLGSDGPEKAKLQERKAPLRRRSPSAEGDSPELVVRSPDREFLVDKRISAEKEIYERFRRGDNSFIAFFDFDHSRHYFTTFGEMKMNRILTGGFLRALEFLEGEGVLVWPPLGFGCEEIGLLFPESMEKEEVLSLLVSAKEEIEKTTFPLKGTAVLQKIQKTVPLLGKARSESNQRVQQAWLEKEMRDYFSQMKRWKNKYGRRTIVDLDLEPPVVYKKISRNSPSAENGPRSNVQGPRPPEDSGAPKTVDRKPERGSPTGDDNKILDTRYQIRDPRRSLNADIDSPQAVAAEVASDMRELEVDMFLSSTEIDYSKVAIVAKRGLAQDKAREHEGLMLLGETLWYEYKVMKQNLVKLIGKEIIEVDSTDDLISAVEELIGDKPDEGFRVIVLDDGTLTGNLSETDIAKGTKGKHYCVISAPFEKLGKNYAQFVNLNGMTLMGVGILFDKLSLFELAYKVFHGKKPPKDIKDRFLNKTLWIISVLPRSVWFDADDFKNRVELQKLFQTAA
ncbi:MAG: GNAT family N-acetyltransferase [Candidatus Omnitrophota bacterium]